MAITDAEWTRIDRMIRDGAKASMSDALADFEDRLVERMKDAVRAVIAPVEAWQAQRSPQCAEHAERLHSVESDVTAYAATASGNVDKVAVLERRMDKTADRRSTLIAAVLAAVVATGLASLIRWLATGLP